MADIKLFTPHCRIIKIDAGKTYFDHLLEYCEIFKIEVHGKYNFRYFKIDDCEIHLNLYLPYDDGSLYAEKWSDNHTLTRSKFPVFHFPQYGISYDSFLFYGKDYYFQHTLKLLQFAKNLKGFHFQSLFSEEVIPTLNYLTDETSN